MSATFISPDLSAVLRGGMMTLAVGSPSATIW
ncbi:hypothetical protein GGE65_008231 [Skermanella aerolata]